ncbi:hypothetical protein F441_20412 [Phytophthora nicotianae CJ01A1]|uniref:Uncharacterized protein n=3 Tax=Phytophthora nicotianae TaxID=4792 RepID=W2Y966_PHYNI|nr:hypothetical protein F444_20535 [Phytophthora nicotianae P1976]ETP02538.1 hypothetical protein F441_20412 [Phytophthora nicotianae CJ01A1]ETP30724.1 hypothetical protein F442_20339 [Phytophthora nicotianae P10297]
MPLWTELLPEDVSALSSGSPVVDEEAAVPKLPSLEQRVMDISGSSSGSSSTPQKSTTLHSV